MALDNDLEKKCGRLVELFQEAANRDNLKPPSKAFWGDMANILNMLLKKASRKRIDTPASRRARREVWAARFRYMRDVQQFDLNDTDDLADIAMAMADEENNNG